MKFHFLLFMLQIKSITKMYYFLFRAITLVDSRMFWCVKLIFLLSYICLLFMPVWRVNESFLYRDQLYVTIKYIRSLLCFEFPPLHLTNLTSNLMGQQMTEAKVTLVVNKLLVSERTELGWWLNMMNDILFYPFDICICLYSMWDMTKK